MESSNNNKKTKEAHIIAHWRYRTRLETFVFFGGGIVIFSGPRNMSASIQRVQKYFPRRLERRMIRRKCDSSDVHDVFDVALPIKEREKRGDSETKRERTVISYKTSFLRLLARWELRRKLFWNPRAATSPGMIGPSYIGFSPWTTVKLLFVFAR